MACCVWKNMDLEMLIPVKHGRSGRLTGLTWMNILTVGWLLDFNVLWTVHSHLRMIYFKRLVNTTLGGPWSTCMCLCCKSHFHLSVTGIYLWYPHSWKQRGARTPFHWISPWYCEPGWPLPDSSLCSWQSSGVALDSRSVCYVSCYVPWE